MNANGRGMSPSVVARLGGALYLVIIVVGALEQFAIRGRVVVPGDIMATAANLRSMETLWRLGIGSELVLAIANIVLTVILYVLLRPVGKDLALVAVAFALVGTAIESAYALQLLQALYPLQSASYLAAFTSQQLAGMARLAIDAHSDGFGISLVFFGCFFPFVAYLIFRSGYFPKVLGVLCVIPGISYTASSFALILAPEFAARWYFVIAGPAIIGEASLCLWLLVKGVNVERWQDALRSAQNAEPSSP